MGHTSASFDSFPQLSGQTYVRPRSPLSFRSWPPDTSGPIWQSIEAWFLFWPLLTQIAGQVVFFSGPARDSMEYQNGGNRGSHYSLYVYLLMLLGFDLFGNYKILSVLKRNRLLLGSLLLAFVSVIWSEAKVITFQMTIQVTICTLFACYLGTINPDRLIRFFLFMGVTSGLLSVVFALALPSYGIFAGYAGGAWQGICNQKNTLGLSTAFLLIPVFFTNRVHPLLRGLYAALMLLLIAESRSRSAWLYTVAMIAFVGWIYVARRLRAYESLLLLISTVVGVAAVVIIGFTYLDSIALFLGKDPTMSGRSLIYREVWKSILVHPILGFGFDSFWGPVTKNPEAIRIGTVIRWPNIGYAENGILELGLQTGFLGVALVLGMILNAFRQGAHLLRSAAYTPKVGWFLTILFLEMLANIDAGRFMTSDGLEWVLVVVACVGMQAEWSAYVRGRDYVANQAAEQRTRAVFAT